MTVTTSDQQVTATRLDWVTVPRVNLLPPEIIEHRGFRRTQRKLAGAVGLVLLACLGITAWSYHQVSIAKNEKAIVEARTAELQSQAAVYAEVPRVVSQVDQAIEARAQAMGSDVLWYRFLDELAVATPESVGLTTLDIKMTADQASAATASAAAATGLGLVTVTGTAQRMPAVANWLTAVSGVHGMDVSRLSSASRGGDNAAGTESVVEFSSSVPITDKALSHRYDRKAG